MITAKSKNGIQRRCILNETIIMADSEDSLSVNVKDEKIQVDFKFNITFLDEGIENSTSGNVSDDGKNITINLHKWNSPNGVELTKPLEYISKNTQKKVWIKFKTWADKKNSFRTFSITIWGEM